MLARTFSKIITDTFDRKVYGDSQSHTALSMPSVHNQ